jgi:hypothetical protein
MNYLDLFEFVEQNIQFGFGNWGRGFVAFGQSAKPWVLYGYGDGRFSMSAHANSEPLISLFRCAVHFSRVGCEGVQIVTNQLQYIM